ncbi:flagellar filament capping protein FliD [Clostridiaceae bacterium HSG29]|nr:flagellar filament capping protein FliD [Clostridiaceae bacterium HSG29]
MSDYTRITGIASGMDTDNMIKDLMKAESAKKDKVEKEQIYEEWRKEEYQSISKMLREYKNNNFDVLSPSTNFRSPSMFADFTSSVLSGGEESSAVTVTGNTNITNLSHTINSITSLASNDLYASTERLKDTMVGDTAINIASIGTINTSIASGNNTFALSFDGVSKSITLDGGYATGDSGAELLVDMQAKIDAEFGDGKILVSFDGSNQLNISSVESGHQTIVIESDANILSNLGFTSGDTDYLKSSETLSEAFTLVTGTDIALTINDVSDFGITTDDTISEMMEKINDSDAGVTMSYSSLSGKFELKSNETGEINKITFDEADGATNDFVVNSLKIDVDAVDGTNGYTEATDAKFEIDGVITSRSNNDFTIDGANYSLKTTSATAIEISLSPDTEGLVEKITSFVDKYNEIIETINTKLDEKRDYDYAPLNADEKEAMSDDDIELWEEKAKSGILGSSNELENIASQLRTLIYEPIEGLNISLKDIGITTSSNYKDNGKLTIDEDTLKSSINNNYGKVVELFTKTSDVDYDDTSNRSTRKAEEGIANRLYDVLQDNIRNTRDEGGNKGILIEKAGYEGEVSDFDNIIQDVINDYDDRIFDILDYLDSKEEAYYTMFAKMEAAMSEMQSQSDWLSSQMG